MLYFLHQLKDSAGALEILNVFQYQTFRAAGACLTAFLLCVLPGNKVILKLTSLKLGQPIRTKEEVHQLAELHGGKTGTPTMGGILIVGAVLIATLLWARISNPFIQTLVFVTLTTGALWLVNFRSSASTHNPVVASRKVKFGLHYYVSLLTVANHYHTPDSL